MVNSNTIISKIFKFTVNITSKFDPIRVLKLNIFFIFLYSYNSNKVSRTD